jgi:hypothetical protein
VHGENVAPSRRHSNVAVSEAVNVKAALVSFVLPLGPEIVVVGATVSTVHAR